MFLKSAGSFIWAYLSRPFFLYGALALIGGFSIWYILHVVGERAVYKDKVKQHEMQVKEQKKRTKKALKYLDKKRTKVKKIKEGACADLSTTLLRRKCISETQGD